jgi:hypothetical protein
VAIYTWFRLERPVVPLIFINLESQKPSAAVTKLRACTPRLAKLLAILSSRRCGDCVCT